MIQLKNVSKYYYSKGMIASGISKVNLNLDIGEFVVITGESGSGKTTLLNVISGLDSYEDGEMYINGKETSHYMASDFEEYRKKYIGNIFQNFNLVNSYTVYQNIELILRINGYKKDEIKKRVPDIIQRVGLEKQAKTKVSKLSGGQKQRTAIARALAKDTDIIVADEPTGNLDSVSAEGIVRLLSEISKDKLVIVVTHNYEQFAPYTTRKIRMHDGKIAEDETITLRETRYVGTEQLSAPLHEETEARKAEKAPKAKGRGGEITVGSKVRLGLRNTFNLFHKFLLLLVVFLFVVFSVSAEYASFYYQKEENESMGYSEYFYNYSENRVVLKKVDGSKFTADDVTAMKNAANVESVTVNDLLLDRAVYLEDDSMSYEAYPRLLDEFDGKLFKGRMPEADNEVILTGYKDDYYFSEDVTEEIIDKSYKVYMDDGSEVKVTVVGLAYKKGDENYYVYGGDLFVTEKLMGDMRSKTYNYNSVTTVDINGSLQQSDPAGGYYSITPNKNVEKGKLLVPEEVHNYYATEYVEGNAVGQVIKITAENLYYKKSIKLEVADVYTDKNFTEKTGYKDFDTYSGIFCVNPADFNRLYRGGNYQASVYVADAKLMEGTLETLEAMGYVTLPLKETLVLYGDEMLSVIQVPIAVIVVLALFFIAYFVIRLILKSRSGYFSILRMLGLARKNVRRIMDVELFTVANIAYAIFLAVAALVKEGVIHEEHIVDMVGYIDVSDVVALYVIIIVMGYLISGKFIKSIFKKSAMGTFREEE